MGEGSRRAPNALKAQGFEYPLSLLAGVAEWQTQGTQNPPLARACRFESGLRHQARDGALAAPPRSVLEPVFLDLVVDSLERELQEFGGLLLVSAGELEGLGEEAALDVRRRVADVDLRDGSLAAPDARLRQRSAEDGPHDRRSDDIFGDAGRAAHGLGEFARVAGPVVGLERVERVRLERESGIDLFQE